MPRTILIFLFGDLGDTILTIPAVRALRTRYPEARFVLLGKELAADYASRLGLVDQCIVVDKHAFDRPGSLLQPRTWASLLRLLIRLRRERADTAVIFHHLPSRWGAIKFALLSLASGAKRRVGLDNGRGWFLTESVRDRGFGARHEAEYWLEIAGLLDAPGELKLEAPVSPGDREAAAELLGEGEFFAVHPGTGWYGPGRRWGGERFAEAAQQLAAETAARCVIVGTELEAGEAETIVKAVPDSIDLIGRTSVGQLGAVLERCKVLLANDGGVAHLGAAVGTPVAAVFGPSNDRAWRPLLGRAIHVDLPCRPCFYRDFETGKPAGCPSRECLSLISPEDVVAVALELLSEPAFAG